MSLSDSLDLPKSFGPYTLLRRVAVGGMAEVYVAKTKGIGGFEKLVAIKVIHPRFSEDAHFVQMLVEEAKIAVQLNHVNIAQTFDLGCIDDTYYIAMEFIEGADTYRIQKRLRERKEPLAIDIAAYIAAEVCNGLAYAHRKRDQEGRPLGIVHRDISPQNVLVSFAGEVKLVDFGIAKAALRGGQTEVGVIKGKYYYMSPEQAWGDPVDGRTDVFATGILLHELLTGEMVYQEENVPQLLDRVRRADVAPPSQRRPEISAELEAIIMKAVAREAGDRYQSAQAMCQDLTRFLYATNATFTAARAGQLMTDLFADEVKRNSQAPPKPELPDDSEERTLDPAQRQELAPQVTETSVLMKQVAKRSEATRNDLPAPKPAARDRATAQMPKPGARESTKTAPVATRNADDWEEETKLKDGSWDESTLIDQGDMMQQVHKMLGAKSRAESSEIAPDKTVAMSSAHIPPPTPQADRAVVTAPKPRPISGAQSLSMELSSGDLMLEAEPAAELPAEKTVAFSPGDPLPAPVGPRRRPAAAPSGAGMRLGPAADKFFSQTTAPIAPPGPSNDPAHPFDPVETGPMPPKPALVDPFGAMSTAPAPVAADPFAYQSPPANVTGKHEPLGKPDPKRWLLAILIGGGALALLVVVIVFLVSLRSSGTALEVITVPDGAQVTLDGHPIAGATPLTISEGLDAEHEHRIEVHKPGYETYTLDHLRLAAGTHQQIFMLNQLHATLHVETDPPGAQVWVDGGFRGAAPLDVIGLNAGQRVEVRAATPGRQTVAQTITIAADDPAPRLRLTLPPN